jgi:aryl-alcohol dehydrogenase-like predicted oxidoreductase
MMIGVNVIPTSRNRDFWSIWRLLNGFAQSAATHGRSPGEVAIGWTLAHPAVTGAIVGARSAEQADGVMGAGTLRLTSQEKTEIEAPNEVTV